MDVVTSTMTVLMEVRDSIYCGKWKLAAKLIGSSMVISTIICFHIICSDTQLGWQLLPPIYYLPPPLLLQSNHIHTIDKPRPALFLRCLLFNYLWKHHYIHLLIYSSSIYWPFLWISKCYLSSLRTCSTSNT